MVLQVYDAFTGLQEDAIVAPAAAGGVTPDAVNKFAQDNALRVRGDLMNIGSFRQVGYCSEGRRISISAKVRPQGGRPPRGRGTGQGGGQPQDPLDPGLYRG